MSRETFVVGVYLLWSISPLRLSLMIQLRLFVHLLYYASLANLADVEEAVEERLSVAVPNHSAPAYVPDSENLPAGSHVANMMTLRKVFCSYPVHV